jgi:hypothetical protein
MIDSVLQGVFGSLLLEGEDGGWMQLLVFVVVGVLYALGGIIKARKRKGGVADQDESPGEPAAPETRREPLRAIARPKQPQGSTVPRKSVLQTFVEEITRAAQLEVQAPRPQNPPPVARTPRIETQVVKLPRKPTGEAIAAIQPKRLAVEAKQQAQADDLPAITPEFASTDDLARAVLDYEIFGKPLSLRDPAEDIG